MELDDEDYELLGWGTAVDKSDIKKNNLNLTKKRDLEYEKQYRKTEHGKKLAKQHNKTWYQKLKKDPVRYRKHLDKVATRMREYNKRKKNGKPTKPKT